jgi:type VI secretion system protein ImpK
MLAEPYSASLVSRFAIPGSHLIPQGYFRSKLFVTTSATNPLVAAASPLFSLLERLCVSPTLPPIHSIRDNIEHELLAFHSQLTSQHYADEFAVIAHYLLSATIDELLGKNYVRLYGQPAEFKAFTPPSHDEQGPQRRFFDIVNYIKERTNQYLDLLELAYYCLVSGFEGELHFRADGRQSLDNLIEELHQLIQQHRVNKPYRLFKEQPTISPEPVNHKPLMATALIVLSMLTSVYFRSHLLLEHKAKNLLLGHTTVLANMDN